MSTRPVLRAEVPGGLVKPLETTFTCQRAHASGCLSRSHGTAPSPAGGASRHTAGWPVRAARPRTGENSFELATAFPVSAGGGRETHAETTHVDGSAPGISGRGFDSPRLHHLHQSELALKDTHPGDREGLRLFRLVPLPSAAIPVSRPASSPGQTTPLSVAIRPLLSLYPWDNRHSVPKMRGVVSQGLATTPST